MHLEVSRIMEVSNSMECPISFLNIRRFSGVRNNPFSSARFLRLAGLLKNSTGAMPSGILRDSFGRGVMMVRGVCAMELSLLLCLPVLETSA
jgi:hypothetical protein